MEDELSNGTRVLAGFSSDISDNVMHLADILEERLLSLWTFHTPKWAQLPQEARYTYGDPLNLPPASRDRDAAASIPIEIFDFVLTYAYPRIEKPVRVLRRRVPSANVEDRLHDIKAYALVCLRWANSCRRHIFSQATLVISSPEDTHLFLMYISQGSRSAVRFKSIDQLIKSISVEQTYQISLPFCHRLFTSVTRTKLGTLQLSGPIPDGLSPNHRYSPCWGFPPSVIITPRQLGFQWITVEDLHLPSFHHVNRYIKYLVHARHLQFRCMTWDEGGPDPPLVFPRRARPQRVGLDNAVSVEASGCTDNFRLCIRVATAHPGFILHILEDHTQRQQAVMLILSFLGFNTIGLHTECHIFSTAGTGKPGLWEWPTLNVMLRANSDNKRNVSMASARLQLTFGDDGAHNATVVGLIAFFGWKEVTIELDHWSAQILETFPTVRAIVFEFGSYERLLPIAMARLHSEDADVISSQHDVAFNFVCGWSHQHAFPEVVGGRSYGTDVCIDIDPSTLTPTGKYWEHSNEVIPSLLRSRRYRH